METLLVTGGAGFIGSNFLIRKIKNGNTRIINYDKLTYAGNLDTLKAVESNPNYFFVEGDICDQELVRKTLGENKVDSIINFAAESHVDRSIESPDDFIQTNIVGTFKLLQASRDYWNDLKENEKNATTILGSFMCLLTKCMDPSVIAVFLLRKHLTRQTHLMRHQKLLQTI